MVQGCCGVSKDRVCPEGKVYVEQQLAGPRKTAILCCEGACIKGEIARVAANMLAYQLKKDTAVRICMGDAATGNTGFLELVQRAPEVIAVEGCALQCGTEILRKRVPDQKVTVIYATKFYPVGKIKSLEIFDTPREVVDGYAHDVAREIAAQYFPK